MLSFFLYIHKVISIDVISAVLRQQNAGLATELGSYGFKPRLNKNSLELASTMPPLRHRVDDMIKQKEKQLAKRRECQSSR